MYVRAGNHLNRPFLVTAGPRLGDAGEGYHCACLGILYNFGAEVILNGAILGSELKVRGPINHPDPSA